MIQWHQAFSKCFHCLQSLWGGCVLCAVEGCCVLLSLFRTYEREKGLLVIECTYWYRYSIVVSIHRGALCSTSNQVSRACSRTHLPAKYSQKWIDLRTRLPTMSCEKFVQPNTLGYLPTTITSTLRWTFPSQVYLNRLTSEGDYLYNIASLYVSSCERPIESKEWGFSWRHCWREDVLHQ